MKHCDSCRHWAAEQRPDDFPSDLPTPGECRHHAPSIDGQGNARFPFIWSDGWCGQHGEREAA